MAETDFVERWYFGADPDEELTMTLELNKALASAYARGVTDSAKVAEGWLATFAGASIEHVSAKKWANDAVIDIASAIRRLIPNQGASKP